MARSKREINVEAGKRLKILIEETGIKQNVLAEEIHLSQQTISQILNGKANLTIDRAKDIVQKFPDYSLYWLLGELPIDVKKSSEIKNALRDLIAEQISSRQSYMRDILDFFGYDCDITSDSVTITNRKTEEAVLLSYSAAKDYSGELLHLMRAFIDYNFTKEQKK